MRLKVLTIVVLLLSGSCAQRNPVSSKAQVSTQSNVNLNEASNTELLGHVGEKVSMHGKWSLRGMVGPYILAHNGPIYLVSKGNFSWEKFERMEGKDVRVTGVLRYAHFEPSAEQHPPDYFYFEAETADVKATGILDCGNANEYRLVVVDNPNRQKDSDPVVPEDLHIVIGDEVISKIEFPKESEAKNFSLNAVEKTETGFEIKVDWCGGVDHYEIQFNFICKENNFYLYEVTKESFSTSNPESGNFLDKKESKVTKIEPNLPIEKFVMTAYL